MNSKRGIHLPADLVHRVSALCGNADQRERDRFAQPFLVLPFTATMPPESSGRHRHGTGSARARTQTANKSDPFSACYYRQEAASDRVETFLRSQDQPVLISRLTELQVASALARWTRSGELDEPQANRIESAFHEDRAAGSFHIIGLKDDTFARAQHWLLMRKTSLRTLDALHLATAEANDAILITLDQLLLQAALWFGVRAQEP